MNMHIVFKISISNLPFSSPIKVKHRLRLIILDTNESHVRDSFIVAQQEADSTNFPTDLFRLFFLLQASSLHTSNMGLSTHPYGAHAWYTYASRDRTRQKSTEPIAQETDEEDLISDVENRCRRLAAPALQKSKLTER